MFSKKLLVLSFSALILFSVPAFAKMGTESGGGGDATELRFNEIRSDILKWINNGGAKELSLPKELSYGQYVDSMTGILEAKKVIIEFTEDKVLVRKVEKTCKGYFQGANDQAYIRCNISRFKNTGDSEQYKLIHHEYAGLVNLEQNKGAASDYIISEQITDYHVEQKVLRLAVKKAKSPSVEVQPIPLIEVETKIVKLQGRLAIINRPNKTKDNKDTIIKCGKSYSVLLLDEPIRVQLPNIEDGGAVEVVVQHLRTWGNVKLKNIESDIFEVEGVIGEELMGECSPGLAIQDASFFPSAK